MPISRDPYSWSQKMQQQYEYEEAVKERYKNKNKSEAYKVLQSAGLEYLLDKKAANPKQSVNTTINPTNKKAASDAEIQKKPIVLKPQPDESKKEKEPYVRDTEHNEPDNSEILFQNLQNAKLAIIKELVEEMGDDFGDNDANIEYRNYLTSIIITPSGNLMYDENGNLITAPAAPYNGTPASDWADAVRKMGKWYEANVHTYQCGATNKQATGKRQAYYFQPGWKVYDDCTGFVSACLSFYGVFNKGEAYSSRDFVWNNTLAQKLENAGFKRFAFSWDSVSPMDIIAINEKDVPKGKHHVEIYDRPGKAWSWGNTHDTAHGGMPSLLTKYNYQYIYRKVT